MVVLVCIPTNSVGGFPFLHTLSSIYCEQASFNFMAAVTTCSGFGAQENKVCHCSHCFPTYLPRSDETGCHDLVINTLFFLWLKCIRTYVYVPLWSSIIFFIKFKKYLRCLIKNIGIIKWHILKDSVLNTDLATYVLVWFYRVSYHVVVITVYGSPFSF